MDCIVCVAQCLERGRNGSTVDVIATASADDPRLTLISDEYAADGLWQAKLKAAQLMKGAFGRVVSFDSPAPPLTGSGSS